MSDTNEIPNDALPGIRNLAVLALAIFLVALFIPALSIPVPSDLPYTASSSFFGMEDGFRYFVLVLLMPAALALMWKVTSGWTIKAGWVVLILLTLGTLGWLANLWLLQEQLGMYLTMKGGAGETMSLTEIAAETRRLGVVGQDLGFAERLDVGVVSPVLLLVGLVLYWWAFLALRQWVFLSQEAE